jgi:hypothetical protein
MIGATRLHGNDISLSLRLDTETDTRAALWDAVM